MAGVAAWGCCLRAGRVYQARWTWRATGSWPLLLAHWWVVAGMVVVGGCTAAALGWGGVCCLWVLLEGHTILATAACSLVDDCLGPHCCCCFVGVPEGAA
jgi:hypothetical protein